MRKVHSKLEQTEQTHGVGGERKREREREKGGEREREKRLQMQIVARRRLLAGGFLKWLRPFSAGYV